MFAGVFGTGLLFERLATFYASTPRGTFTLPDLLNVDQGVIVFAIVLIALAGFKVAERLEARSAA
jgi:hypothetical protein